MGTSRLHHEVGHGQTRRACERPAGASRFTQRTSGKSSIAENQCLEGCYGERKEGELRRSAWRCGHFPHREPQELRGGGRIRVSLFLWRWRNAACVPRFDRKKIEKAWSWIPGG